MDIPLTEADMKITKGLFESLRKQQNNKEFSDVVVVAGSSEFHCHRVILTSVSGFFRGLLASGMRESLEKKVTLSTLSAEAFSQVLTCIYTGRSVLNDSNIFDIWAAVDLLDIGFMPEQCKAFFKDTISVDNCFRYCVSVRLLSGENNKEAMDLIVKNFNKLCCSEQFFQLTFDEMKYIVSSETLSLSCEDDVIETVLRWAEFTSTLSKLPNSSSLEEDMGLINLDDKLSSSRTKSSDEGTTKVETALSDSKDDAWEEPSRSELLAELLECSRYLLTSCRCLVNTLSCHPLVKENATCNSIVREIFSYFSNSDLHQEWCPPEAIHRNNEGVKNVLIRYDCNGKLNVMYPPDTVHRQMGDSSMNLHRHFQPSSEIFHQDGCLYLFGSSSGLSFYTPGSVGWKNMSTDRAPEFTALIAKSVYSFEKNTEDKTTKVYKLSLQESVNCYPNTARWQPVCQLSVEGLDVIAVTSIGNKVIVFWAVTGMKAFTVECFDLYRRKSTVMEDQLGSVANLVTFRRDKETFAIQANGALWRINLCPSSDRLVFTQERQLWDGHATLRGAVLYGTRLFIFGNNYNLFSSLTDVSLDGVFEGIIFHDLDSHPYVHAVLPKHILCMN
ncbi:kelch-like protein 5 [Plakobranchus ocellatus]|uniref:Kelch-like protein 5 n=1 Tax=Plakobranchus ocellatus TaxID=259542 RepID=A0AAV4DN55_9GAST|nr:kelch-like protein 5 [Plakobranchus ocellatus]